MNKIPKIMKIKDRKTNKYISFQELALILEKEVPQIKNLPVQGIGVCGGINYLCFEKGLSLIIDPLNFKIEGGVNPPNCLKCGNVVEYVSRQKTVLNNADIQIEHWYCKKCNYCNYNINER